jgi:photosystem II stability/assembly factor-like uncharacterized protein
MAQLLDRLFLPALATALASACAATPDEQGPILTGTADLDDGGTSDGDDEGGDADSSGSGDTSTSTSTSTSTGDGDGDSDGDGTTSGGSTDDSTDDGGESSSSGGTSAGTGGDGEPTEDGWAIVDVGTDEDLLAVDFADEDHGWVVGTNEVLLHTDDGGGQWTSQNAGFFTKTVDTKQLDAHVVNPYPKWGAYHLLDVHAPSPSVAWVSSIGPLTSPPSIDADDLTCVFVTADGGATWTRASLATNFQAWGIHGFDATSARVATIGSTDHPDSDVYRIAGGANQASTAVTWGGLRAITFAGTQNGWAVGVEIYRTQDGGSSWSTVNAPAGPWWDVAFVDADHGVAVGEAGAIAVTEDGGQSWQARDPGTGEDLYGVSIADGQHGFAVGHGGVVLRTQDGGDTWQSEASGTGAWLNDVATLGGDEAWATGDGGVLVHRLP